MEEQQVPFAVMGVLVTCHGQQIALSGKSPGVCLVCQGIITLADLKINYQRPSPIQIPH